MSDEEPAHRVEKELDAAGLLLADLLGMLDDLLPQLPTAMLDGLRRKCKANRTILNECLDAVESEVVTRCIVRVR